jgi:hypothetical protein
LHIPLFTKSIWHPGEQLTQLSPSKLQAAVLHEESHWLLDKSEEEHPGEHEQSHPSQKPASILQASSHIPSPIICE